MSSDSIDENAIAIVKLSPEELLLGTISSYNLEKALVGFEKDGIFIIENGADPDQLDVLNKRMVPEAETLYLKKETHRNFGENTGNIQQEPVPYPEYLFEDVIANKFVSAITECILGPKPIVRFYSSNTAFKATDRQPVHIDCDFKYQDHCFGLCVNVNLVSTSEANGATELWPGSHRMAKFVEEEVTDELKLEYLKTRSPIQPSLPKGAIIVRDFRLWHAGMPNHSDQPRIMLATVQFPHWYRSNLKIKLPESAKDKLSSFNPKIDFAVDYIPNDVDYLKGSHDHTFEQTF